MEKDLILCPPLWVLIYHLLFHRLSSFLSVSVL